MSLDAILDGVAANALTLIIVFHVIESLWEIYITYRQALVYRTARTVPSALRDVITTDTFEKARAYSLDKIQFSLFKMCTVSLFLTTAEIYFNLLAHLWSSARTVTAAIGLDATNEMLCSCAFVLLMSVLGTIKDLPFAVYFTFVVEQRHGFNKQTAGFYVKDQLKSFAVSQALALPVVVAVIWIVRIGGAHFYVWLWMFAGVLMLVMLTVYPIWIAPLFDKYSPLEVGELRTAIEALAGRLKFPLKQLYVVEGSKRSAHSNAYFYGLWNSKRIVLFDTLLAGYKKEEEKEKNSGDGEKPEAGCQNDEVIAVLAHELGHWKLNHVTKNICIGQVHMFLMFAAFGWLFGNEQLYRVFGFEEGERPVIIGLILICNYILAVYNALISFGVTVLSRKFEFEADAFAVGMGLGEPLGRALVKLNVDNLGFPVYDWLYSAWNHSHPSLLARLARMGDGKGKKTE